MRRCVVLVSKPKYVTGLLRISWGRKIYKHIPSDLRLDRPRQSRENVKIMCILLVSVPLPPRRLSFSVGAAVTRTMYRYLVTFYLASGETHCCDDPLPSLAGWSPAAEIALVRTESSSLCARLRSIEWVARRVLGLWESIAHHPPLLGNIRAGAWYVPPCAQRSFFKSADGHCATGT
jgi:Rit1 N-terminal domain